MVEYECKRCKKIFDRKSNYDSHINRKIKCVIIKKETSDKIIELTEENENLKIEKEEVKKKKEEIEKEKEKIQLENEKIASEKLLLQKNIEDLKEIINKLITESSNKSPATINITKNVKNTNNNTNNIQQNNIIKLNPYKKEDMSHITEKDYNRYLTLGYGSVPTLVKDIHFNDKKPENHNILLPRGDCNDIYVYNNEDEWECKDKNVLIEQLIADKTNLLSKKRDEKDENKKFSFDNYYESYEEQNEKKMKTVKENVKRVCLTGKDKVMKTKKLVIKN